MLDALVTTVLVVVVGFTVVVVPLIVVVVTFNVVVVCLNVDGVVSIGALRATVVVVRAAFFCRNDVVSDDVSDAPHAEKTIDRSTNVRRYFLIF